MRAVFLIAALAAGAGIRMSLTGQPVQASRGPAKRAQQVFQPRYYIPDNPATVGHWNALDLASGGAEIDPPWTLNGSVALAYASPTLPANVGVFSDSNYFSLPAGNVLNFTVPFTVALIVDQTGAQATVIPLAIGPAATSGWYFQTDATHIYFTTNVPTTEQLQVTQAVASGVHVFMMGWDGADIWLQMDGGSPSTKAVASHPTNSATTAYLGRYTSSGFSAGNMRVVELMASSAPPSAASFTAIYNAVAQQLP